MAYTVTNLIVDAYSDSSVVARQFETVQGYQLSDGLRWLNELLGDKTMDTGDIPYITVQYPLVGVVGQEQYFIPNCIDIEAIVFYIGSVRYQMQYLDRGRYFGYPRANNINALPLAYHYERTYGGINLWVYFYPQEPYVFNITGNFFVQSVSLNQDLQSQVVTANLGVPSLTSTAFTLNPGQLVINNVDLTGSYASLTAFIAYINTGIIPPVPNYGYAGLIATTPAVTASTVGTQFILTNTGTLSQGSAAYILINSNGVQNGTNLTFTNFSTINGPYVQPYFCTSWDRFYINYLEYQLAERICQKLNFDVPPGVALQLARYQSQINKLSEPLDLMSQKVSVLSGSKAINYAQISIGQGWTVSNY
jgi:hypothetical protein